MDTATTKTSQTWLKMNRSKNTVLSKFAFLFITICYFVGMAAGNDLMQMIFKPLLISSLLSYFIISTKNIASPFKKWVVGALVFSIAGDILLMFANANELYFLLGLSAFLIAHIFYIICFHKIKMEENIEGKWQWAIVVVIYYFLIISILMPHLGEMKIPVLVYGLVISFMLLVAMHLYDLPNNKIARYILTGALFFVVSDSVLAVNKFYKPFAASGWLIMITYIAAQYLLTEGMIRYVTGKSDLVKK